MSGSGDAMICSKRSGSSPPRIENARAPRERAQILPVRRQFLRLEVVQHLDAVLHGPEKNVGLRKLGGLLVGEQPLLAERVQGLEGAPLPKRPVAAPIDE